MRKFKKIYIEITNVCNLSCDFCPKTQRKGEFMSRELFERVLSQVRGHTKFIYFHVMGEPLLHPLLAEFLDLCADYGCRVNLTTNGTLIEEASETLLAKPALRQVNFSLHSFEGNPSTGSVDEYLDPILRFVLAADQRSELLVALRLWNLQEEGNRTLNSYVLQKIEKALSLDFPLEERLTPCSGLKLGRNIFLNQALTFRWPDIQDPAAGETGFCLGLRDQAGILVDGTVIPCCLDCEGIINLGNIKEYDFEQIITGDRAKTMYDAFSNRRTAEPLCRKCEYRTRFNL
jgi:radical SAM protein with 4Fe4S-binding SPASM domain